MKIRYEPAGRMPQLDGLRAIAIAGVVVLHFYPGGWLAQHVPLGLGVDLFFVISGFLITRILLAGRGGDFMLNFYIRRAMRLFPIYYLTLAALLLGYPQVRDAWPYYAFYGVNIWVAEHGWGIATHFWSLALEEQFYLLWPFAVLFLPRRFLPRICIAAIIGAPLFRITSIYLGHNEYLNVLLLGRVDELAVGCLLALDYKPQFPRWASVSLGTISLCAAVALYHTSAATLMHTASLLAFWLIVDAASRSHAPRFLDLAPVRYLGRISYGVYVLHYSIAEWIRPLKDGGHFWTGSLLFFGVTILFAAASWRFIEQPINRLRPTGLRVHAGQPDVMSIAAREA